MTIYNLTQFSKEGKTMLRMAFNQFLDSLILEHKKCTNDCYSLFASDLPYLDKKEFLSHIVTIDDYEFFTQDPVRERLAIDEYEKEMQYLIDIRIDDLYYDIQREMRS
jgi:hypothetical protein